MAAKGAILEGVLERIVLKNLSRLNFSTLQNGSFLRVLVDTTSSIGAVSRVSTIGSHEQTAVTMMESRKIYLAGFRSNITVT